MKNFWNRTISLALAVIMAFGAAPAAFAIELEEIAQEPVLEEQEEEIPAEEPEQNFEGVNLEYENDELLSAGEEEPVLNSAPASFSTASDAAHHRRHPKFYHLNFYCRMRRY